VPETQESFEAATLFLSSLSKSGTLTASLIKIQLSFSSNLIRSVGVCVCVHLWNAQLVNLRLNSSAEIKGTNARPAIDVSCLRMTCEWSDANCESTHRADKLPANRPDWKSTRTHTLLQNLTETYGATRQRGQNCSWRVALCWFRILFRETVFTWGYCETFT
jgi:hypothetical protein